MAFQAVMAESPPLPSSASGVSPALTCGLPFDPHQPLLSSISVMLLPASLSPVLFLQMCTSASHLEETLDRPYTSPLTPLFSLPG